MLRPPTCYLQLEALEVSFTNFTKGAVDIVADTVHNFPLATGVDNDRSENLVTTGNSSKPRVSSGSKQPNSNHSSLGSGSESQPSGTVTPTNRRAVPLHLTVELQHPNRAHLSLAPRRSAPLSPADLAGREPCKPSPLSPCSNAGRSPLQDTVAAATSAGDKAEVRYTRRSSDLSPSSHDYLNDLRKTTISLQNLSNFLK